MAHVDLIVVISGDLWECLVMCDIFFGGFAKIKETLDGSLHFES